jgi:hypothetical protein
MLCMTVLDCKAGLQRKLCNLSDSTCHTSASLSARTARVPVRLSGSCVRHPLARRLQPLQHSAVRACPQNARVTSMSAGELHIVLSTCAAVQWDNATPLPVTLGNACAETIDGKGTAATIRKEIAAEVADLKEKTGKVGAHQRPHADMHAMACRRMLA